MSDSISDDDGRMRSRVSATSVEVPVSSLIVLGLLVVGTILLLRAIDRTQQLIGLAVFAAILSTLLAPAVTWLQRPIGRTAATVLLHIGTLIVLVAGTGLILQQIQSEADSLAAFTEEQIEAVDTDPGETLESSRFDDRLGEAAASWGTTAIVGEDDATGIATRASQLAVVIVLSIFFTLQGTQLVNMAVAWTDDRSRRRRLRERWSVGAAAASMYLRRNVLVAVSSGLGASGVAAAFGLPAIVLVGVWAALLSVVPLLGAVVGWAPLVLLAAIETSIQTTIAVSTLAVGGVIAVNVLRAAFVTAPVKPGSFLIAMSIASGLTAAGIPGAGGAMFATVAAVTMFSRPPATDGIDDEQQRPDPPAPATDSITSAVLEELAHDHDRYRDLPRTTDHPLVLTLSKRTALQITGFVIVAFAVQLAITRVGPILVWALIGAVIAVGLDRPVGWIERRLHIQRASIVIITAIGLAAVVGALLFASTGSIDVAQPFDDGVPELVDAIEGLPAVGNLVDGADLERRIERFQEDVPRLLTRSSIGNQTFGLLSGGIVAAFWITVAALSCLLDGPRLIAALARRLPARIARQTTRLARAGKVAIGGYVAGAAVVALMNGTIVALLAIAVGVPLVAVLALWAFSWNFIPQIGAIVGWAPLLLLALLESPVRGGLCLAFFVVYQVVENNAIQPTIVGHAVDISALAALGAALAGGALAGLVGAALAIPIAGVMRALHRESQSDDFPPFRTRPMTGDAARPLP